MNPVRYAETVLKYPLKVENGWRIVIVYEDDRFEFAEPFIEAAVNLDLEMLILKLPTPTETTIVGPD